MGAYDDIINYPHHQSKTHSKMSLYDRSAQFAPFAALSGYGEAINETGRYVDQKRELDESEKEEISMILNNINNSIKDNPKITVIYFVKDKKKNGGSYLSYIGQVKRIDLDNRQVVFLDTKKINIEDITSIILN